MRQNRLALLFSSLLVLAVSGLFAQEDCAFIYKVNGRCQPLGYSATPSAASRLTPLQLRVRGIGVRMTHDQVLAAGKAAGMVARVDTTAQIELADPTASGKAVGGASSSGGTGLILNINFRNGQSVQVSVREQGDTSGFVERDLEKKWGAPKSAGGPDFWGNPDDVFANCDHQIGYYGTMTVVIRDAKADTQVKAPERKGVVM
jgi:hypothetical protein